LQHSLLNRFQGSLLGSFLGETLPIDPLKRGESRGNRLEINAIALASDGTDFLDGKNPTNSAEAALAMLKALLFYHDSESLRQERLAHFVAQGRHSDWVLEDVLIWGSAIALALRGTSAPDCWIEQILSRYQTAQTPSIEQLALVRDFLERGTSLQQAIAQMARQIKSKQMAIAIALYCFLSTPDDFRLSLMRAMQAGKEATVVAALTGALAGAYNSFSGIPIGWRIALGKHSIGQQRLQEATELFAVWSGAYRLNSSPLLESAAVASPLVMQPRPSLKIISQEEYSFLDTFFKVDSKVIKK
jgi:ADP-ribosylglycohydrolase